MIACFAAQDRPRRVIGIDASAKAKETHEQVARIARQTADLIGIARDLRDDEIILDDRYHAGTYGIPGDRTLAAIRLSARLEGMITDPVYEGKPMAGLIDLVSRREIKTGSTVLYAHLGGPPALNAYSAAPPLTAGSRPGHLPVSGRAWNPRSLALTGLGHARRCACPPTLARESSRISLGRVGPRGWVPASRRVHDRVHTAPTACDRTLRFALDLVGRHRRHPPLDKSPGFVPHSYRRNLR